jgi:hypothetical protein
MRRMKEWFYCSACDVTFLFQGNAVPGHKDDDAEVRCLDCQAVLGHLRCDVYPPAPKARWKGQHIGRMADE